MYSRDPQCAEQGHILRMERGSQCLDLCVALEQIEEITVEEQGGVENGVRIERVDGGPRWCLKVAV